MTRIPRCLAHSLALVGLLAANAGAADKIKVLIVDGQNNHNWVATTPVLKKELEDSSRFVVDVATSPQLPKLQQPTKPKDPNDEKAVAKYEKDLAAYQAALPKFKEDLKAAQDAFAKWKIDFANYDVVVSNYNGQSWPKAINDELEERLKEGKIGLVIIHAANNSFGGWTEYNLMIGMGWRDKNYGERLILDDQGKPVRMAKGEGDGSGHRYTGPFSIVVRDADHPITKGMPSEWMHNNDELYDNMRGPIKDVHILATAYSKGTKAHEPMIWTVSYGKGRVFHTPMGHDVNAMKCNGFAATVQRGTEWAATGKVTLPIPDDFPTATEIRKSK